MEGIWIEVSVITKSEALEPISGIFYGLGCPNVAIEDPQDLLSRDQGPLTWDFADINILEHKGNAAVVKAYFSQDDKVDEIIDTVKKGLEELKKMDIEIGEGSVSYKEMHEEDWANNWKQYYKPVKITDKIVIKPIWEQYEESEKDLVIELDLEQELMKQQECVFKL